MCEFNKENPWATRIEQLKRDERTEEEQSLYVTNNNPKYQSINVSKLTRKMIPLSDNTLVAYLHGLKKVHKDIEKYAMKQTDSIHVATHHHYISELLDDIICIVETDHEKQQKNKTCNLQEAVNRISLELNSVEKYIQIMEKQVTKSPLDEYTKTISLACLQSKVEAYKKVLEIIKTVE